MWPRLIICFLASMVGMNQVDPFQSAGIVRSGEQSAAGDLPTSSAISGAARTRGMIVCRGERSSEARASNAFHEFGPACGFNQGARTWGRRGRIETFTLYGE
uniref:Putative secreted protein n=1 Tax=Ixodes ricinus TaxID=34613 RepID=A0A6B0U755_IXORI